MQCELARTAIVERTLGLLRKRQADRLQRHLDSCPGCREEATIENHLASDLRLLRGGLPFQIDVVPGVLATIGKAGYIRRDDLSTRQLGWAAVATVFGSVLLLAALVGLWSDMVRSAEGLLVLASSLKLVVVQLAAPLFSFLSGLLGACASLFTAAIQKLDALPDLRPLGLTFTAAGTAMMLASITLVLIREFRRPVRACLEEDR